MAQGSAATGSRWQSGVLADARSDYGRLFDGNPQPMWIFDLETLGIVDVNEAAVRSYGYSRAQFRSLSLPDIRPPEDVPRLLAHLPHTRDKWTAGTSSWRHRKKDGSLIDVEITSFRLSFAGRASRVVIANDVTAKRRAEARVRRLVDALVHAEQAERNRIARELHDDTAQSLAALLIELECQEAAPDLRARVARTLEGVRRLARGLRPVALAQADLSSALERLAGEIALTHAIRVDLVVDGLREEPLPASLEMALYRMAQEALTNAARHSGAPLVSLVLRRTPDEIRMIVEDAGRGFDVLADATDDRLGLSGIRDRVALLGGTLILESAPGLGTSLCIAIPLRGAP
jgi:PAS domain S-box-containing protein